MSRPEEQTKPETTTYADAQVRVGEKPDRLHRSDLIVNWGFGPTKWHWCRDVEMSLDEAIRSHALMGDRVLLVSERITKGSHQSKMSERGKPSGEPPSQSVAVQEPSPQDTMRSRRREPVDESEILSPEGPTEEAPAETEKLEGIDSLDIPIDNSHDAGNAGREDLPTLGKTGSGTEDIPARRKILWMEDYLTAGLAISTVLMLVPLSMTALFARQTFLPTWFAISTVSFAFGTVVAIATQSWRRGKKRDAGLLPAEVHAESNRRKK